MSAVTMEPPVAEREKSSRFQVTQVEVTNFGNQTGSGDSNILHVRAIVSGILDGQEVQRPFFSGDERTAVLFATASCMRIGMVDKTPIPKDGNPSNKPFIFTAAAQRALPKSNHQVEIRHVEDSAQTKITHVPGYAFDTKGLRGEELAREFVRFFGE